MIATFAKRVHGPIYESRLRVLARLVIEHLRTDDRVLDVGCGVGTLGKYVVESQSCPPGVVVTGLEIARRDADESIPVIDYGGDDFPFGDAKFDLAILADVLHHAERPHKLIAESLRVARRGLLIKDHRVEGRIGYLRVALIDWAANAPYDVPCTYRYNSHAQWEKWYERHGLVVEREFLSLRLYPPIVNLVFGGNLQYFAYVRARAEPE